ncbi:MAG TPA: hypothetical protein VNC84_02095 [Gammaproteobacteria bacterium]|nr:hypothetical protein [Gammaproteobacteria bacterium]
MLARRLHDVRDPVEENLHYALALMAKDVYSRTGVPIGGDSEWRRETGCDDPDDGLAFSVYTRNDNRVKVVAFRGTDPTRLPVFIRNIIMHGLLLLGKGPDALTAKKNKVLGMLNSSTLPASRFSFLSKVRQKILALLRPVLPGRYQLYFTGHSLGGVLAQLVGIGLMEQGHDCRIVVFESPGVQHLLPSVLSSERIARLQSGHLVTYVTYPNPMNTFASPMAMGKVFRIQKYTDRRPFYALYKDKAMHVARCIGNDLLRLYFLMWLFSSVMLQVTSRNAIMEKWQEATNLFLEDNFYRKDDLLVYGLYTFLNLPLQFSWASFLLLVMFYVVDELKDASSTHGIQTVVDGLNPRLQKLKPVQIESWPSRGGYLLETCLVRPGTWLFGLFSPSGRHPSIAVAHLGQEELRGRQMRLMSGYQEAET